jgi:hypothetical protein
MKEIYELNRRIGFNGVDNEIIIKVLRKML